MAIVVQKSAGNLSALVSENEFYQVVAATKIFPCNDYQTAVSTSPIYINFTPTAAQDFKGVILCLYCAEGDGVNAKSRSITVELEENVPGWTSRLSKTFSTDDFIPDNTWARCKGLIDVRFASTYTLTTAANTWRLKIYHDGTGSGTFYLVQSENTGDDNIFHICYSDTTVTLTSNDVLVLTDKITLDDDLSLEKADADSGTQRRMNAYCRYYSIYGCMPNITDGAVPQIHVPSTAAADYTLNLKGAFYISSYEKGLLVGEDANNPLPGTREFTVYFSDNSGSNKTGFLAGGPGVGTYGKLSGIELWGTKPDPMWAELADDAASGQADIKVKGDVTGEWSAGDYLEIGGAQYTSTRQYRDYYRNEYLEIDSLSYDAGDDETTITFTSNLSYNHYYESDDMPIYVCYCERNITWKGNDTTYTNESRSNLMGAAYVKLQGVRLQDIYQNLYTGSYKSELSASQQTDAACLIDGCHFHDNYWSFYFEDYKTEVEMTNCTSSSAGTGIAALPYNYAIIALVYSKDATISNNILNGRAMFGVYLGAGRGHDVSDNYFNAVYGIYLYARTEKHTIENNQFFSCRAAIRLASAHDITFSGNEFRKIHYDSDYAATGAATHGCYCHSSDQSSTKLYSENDDADDAFAYVVIQNNAFADHTFKNAKLGSTWTDDVVAESATDYRDNWLPDTEVKFEDYDEVTGDCRSWFTNGYIVSCGTGLPDTISRTAGAGMKAWRFERYFDDEPLELELTTPIGTINEPVTVTIFCKINSANYSSGTYNPPKLAISGCGVSGDTIEDEADVSTTDWQLLSVSGTPTSAGQLTITLSIETDASGSDSYVYWDDMYISYKTPLDFGGLDYVHHGLPVFPPLTVVLTAQNVWSEQLSANRVAGSMGEAIHDIKWGNR